LWYPLAVAALNQSPETVAAEPFVRVLTELFGPHIEDSAVGLPSAPLDEVFALPAARFVERQGGRVFTSAPARVVTDAFGRIAGVRTPGMTITTARVISAVPWHEVGKVWAAGPPAALGDLVGLAARMTASPIVTVNLWFDGPVLQEKFVGFVDGPVHWAFDKGAIVGGRASHLSVVSSGADAIASLSSDAITEIAMTSLRRSLPRLADRRLRRSLVVRERWATFSLAPGAPPRPAAATAVPGFVLAGDWVDTGLPATIEGAVRSGHAAADLV
jgi:hypothetical protein